MKKYILLLSILLIMVLSDPIISSTELKSSATTNITLTISNPIRPQRIDDMIFTQPSQNHTMRSNVCIAGNTSEVYSISFSGNGPNQRFELSNQKYSSPYAVTYHHKGHSYTAKKGQILQNLSPIRKISHCDFEKNDSISVTLKNKTHSKHALTGSLTMLIIPQ